MRLRPTAILLPLLGLVPSLALALALGDIELLSALNEPFDAEIEISSATPAELDKLTVQVAPRDTFERYGLERPEFLSNFVFTVDRARNVLRVRSRQPVAEPFVTFLVEAQWRRGRLLREYTVLLDPPVFMPTPERRAAPAPAPVVAPRSVVAQPSATTGVIERPRAARSTREVSTPAGPVSFGANYGPIRRGETLWNIAERLRIDRSLTTNQVMIAIYRANQDAFLGNINLVKEGSTLRIPDRAAIERLNQQEAFSSAVAHNQAWRSGTPAAVASVASAPRRTSTPAPPESSRLKLVEPDLATAGGSAVASGAGSAASAAAEREMRARNEAEIARLAGENDQLRADLEEIRRLISVRDSELATMQRQLAEGAVAAGPGVAPTPTPVPPAVRTDGGLDLTPSEPAGVVDVTPPPSTLDPLATEPGVAVSVTPDTAVSPDVDSTGTPVTATTPIPEPTVPATTVEPEPEPAPVPVTASIQEEPGFFSGVLSALIGLATSLWFYIALGVLALGAFAAFALRGRGADEPDALDALTAETVMVPALPDTHEPARKRDDEVEFFDDSGTFKPVDFAAAKGAEETADYPFEDTVGAASELKLDQADPMAEADFHMAYGLYDQAADLVRKAVAREPDRVDLRMKLLEIFFVWGNQDDFRATAQELRTSMGSQIDGEWDKIVIMGKQICPDDELFAGGAGIGSGADIDLEFDTGDSQEVDVGVGGGSDLDLAFGDDSGGLDLAFGDDTTGDSSSIKLSPELEKLAVSSEDLTAENTSISQSDEGGLDFDLGLEFADATPEPIPDPEPETAEQVREQIKSRLSSIDNDETAEMDLSDLGVDLDLGTGSAPALPEAPAQDDFESVFTGETDATSEMPMPTAELTAGAKGLDLDIGSMFGDDTASELNAPDTSDTGRFSAEIETLHGDALDVDISSFGEAGHDETRLIEDDDEPTAAPVEEAFSVSVFGDESDMADDTRLIGPGDTNTADDEFAASVFGNAEDETVLTEAMGQRDDLATDVFNFDGDFEGGVSEMDLDIGESMSDADGDKTTVKVATADLALPEGQDELGEVGTKLDLARAYMDMGDPDGARGILEEVMSEGNESQQADARQMLESIS